MALQHRHPVSIVTKSKLILRDADLLAELAGLQLVNVMVSVTTLSNALKVKLEPRTASPAARLGTIERLHGRGVPVGAMAAPIIPFINDEELEAIVARSAAAGARAVRYVLLRLPLEVKDLFEAWLAEHYPLRAERVMSAIRDIRGGRAYDSTWGRRMRGSGPFAELLAARFRRGPAGSMAWQARSCRNCGPICSWRRGTTPRIAGRSCRCFDPLIEGGVLAPDRSLHVMMRANGSGCRGQGCCSRP